MYLIRDVQPDDLGGLVKVARALDTVNLPDDRDALEALVSKSVDSFAGRIRDPKEREYLFVLEHPEAGLVGTSMVIAQHGTRTAPHVFFRVSVKEHYSTTLDRHFSHQVLAIHYNYEGPTEIGGLVVLPEHRHRDKPGKQISYARFLWMAMHRERFQDRVLAELLPPLLPDGRSRMWEYLGARFTGLTYQEADWLSRTDKEFIRSLFPQGEIYATLLPKAVQRSIGRVGPETVGVRKMLERIGFRYAGTIDPFDGGPHFVADTGEITLLRDHQTAALSSEPLTGEAPTCLVGVERRQSPQRFRAVRAPARVENDRVYIPAAAAERLEASPRTRLHLIPC